MILQTSTRALFSYSCPFSLLVPTHRDGHEWKKRARVRLAPENLSLYRPAVAANSATGFRSPSKQKAHKRHCPKAGAFFMPALSFYGGCAWDTFGYAGFLLPRSANPRTATTHIRFAANGGSSSAKGASPMQFSLTQNPSAPSNKAAAHRAMAMAALRANSSLSVRLKRYNHHMDQARALEAQGGVQ